MSVKRNLTEIIGFFFNESKSLFQKYVIKIIFGMKQEGCQCCRINLLFLNHFNILHGLHHETSAGKAGIITDAKYR